MAKRLLLIAVGALALTACTSSDVIDDVASSRNQIRFETAVNKPTRAVEELAMETLSEFQVFGFYTMPGNVNHAHEIFNNITVKKDGSSWNYASDEVPLRYWVPDATYYFYAYSCGNKVKLGSSYGNFSVDMEENDGVGKPASERVLEITDYICDNTHQHDLIFASNTGYKANGSTDSDVSFTFNHLLSKIQAKFTSKFASEYTVVIKNVRLENICNKGNYDFTSGWNKVVRPEGQTPLVYLQNTTGYNIEKPEKNLEVTNEIVKDEKTGNDIQASAASNCAYVIPFAYDKKEVYLKFEVDVMYGEDKVISKSLSATLQPDWKSGYSYIYNIEIDPASLKMDQINFSVSSINGWTTESENTPIDK